jgi:Domain of unknown function (DUF4276)
VSVRLGISVEGQTEERFVKDLLAPHLVQFGVHATPVIVATSRSAGGLKAKGGGINIDRVARELQLLLRGHPDGYVTSLYDFYGFADKRPGETVDRLEGRIASALNTPHNLIAYVQLHEFEGLLLSNAAVAASYFEASAMARLIEDTVSQIQDTVSQAGSPEAVNEGPSTAPSKRLEAWTRQLGTRRLYSKATKTLHGPGLATRLTLPVIRKACPRFAAWLARLETLATN